MYKGLGRSFEKLKKKKKKKDLNPCRLGRLICMKNKTNLISLLNSPECLE